jgi:hypothetical protein
MWKTSFLVLVASAILAGTSSAQTGMTPQAEMRACEVLAANQSWSIRTQLSTFQSDVLGRNTLEWRADDFDRILNAAKACDGYQSRKNGLTVWNKDWEDQITQARNYVMPVVEGFSQAVKHAAETPRTVMRVPACPKLLDWRFEPKSFSSNAAEIFGGALFELSAKDLRAASNFASDCANSLAVYAIGKFQIPQERTFGITSRLVEVVNAVADARDDFDKEPKRPTDVVAKIEGFAVPPRLAHERMQMVIRRFNQLNIRGGGMSAEGISELEQGIAAVMNRSDISAVDQAFADAIRARINSDIFGSQASR